MLSIIVSAPASLFPARPRHQWKRLTTGVIGVLIASSAALAQDQGRYAVKQQAFPCLKFRPSPSTSATPSDCLVPGITLTALESIPYWRRVRLDDSRTGWVAKMFLEPVAGGSPAPSGGPTSDAWLEVHFVDVGQGDGIWIHTFDDGIDGNGKFEGKNIAIDGGPRPSAGEKAFWEYIEEKGHHNGLIDALFLSHPHDDHYSGADGIRRHFRIGNFYDPGFLKSGVAYPNFLGAMQQDQVGGRVGQVLLGRSQFGSLDWGSELRAEVLYSYPGNDAGLGSDSTLENNSSIVLRLEYGAHSFLFMGDAEGKDRQDTPADARYVEKVLLDSIPPAKLKSTVLKVAHHGSETSSTLPFIQAVDPDIVVISSGRRSFRGTFIPRVTTLKRYCCHDPDTRIYRTDQNDEAAGLTSKDDADGDHIVIRTNGTQIEVRAFQAGQPFQVDSCQPVCGS